VGRIETGRYSSRDGTGLYWETRWPDADVRAHVALVHGFGDHTGRYAAWMDRLAAEGYAAHGFDYRGHGRSDGQRGHCKQFADFHDDLAVHLAAVADRAAGGPRVVFCHSHGGLITSSYHLDRGLEGISAVLFSSPWLELALRPTGLKLLAARVARRVMPTLPFSIDIAYDQLSRDLAWQETTRMDPLYGRKGTPSWFFAALETQERVLSGAAGFALPMIVHHGTADAIAKIDGARRFEAGATSKDKAFRAWEGLRHELVHEIGREEVMADWLAWIAEKATVTGTPARSA
jgi:alpha-beta hydrolase superfamily lysophospholipase